MSDLSPTLSSLLGLGFERRPDSYGLPTVGYRFPMLDLTASDSVSRYFTPVVLLGGVLNTGRTIAEIHSEIPPTLGTPEQAAAWVSYALRNYGSELEPLPDWMLLGEQHWDLIPSVRRQREYELRPCCLVARDHARILRRSLQEALSQLDGTETMTFRFDGRVLVIRLGGREFAAIASGEPWATGYEITVTRDTRLPSRFMSESVAVSWFDDRLSFDKFIYPARATRG